MTNRPPSSSVDWILVRRFVAFCSVFLVGGLLLSFLYQPMWLPIFVGLFISYLLVPWVDRFGKSGAKRVCGILGFLLLFYTIVALLAIWGLPELYTELFALTRRIPAVYQTLLTKWVPWLQSMLISSGLFSPKEISTFFVEWKEALQLVDRAQQALTTLWRTVPNVLGTVLNFCLIPVVSFCILQHYHSIRHHMTRYVPHDLRAPLQIFGHRVDQTIRSVLKGQVTVAFLVTLCYLIGFSLIGLPSALTIGVIAGSCRLIPYLDLVVGGVLSLIVILSDFHGMGQLLSLLIVFVTVQSLDGMVITPRIIGERIGLHPMIVILSILSFAQWFGFWGVLLAIPTIALLKVLWVSATPFYWASSFFLRR
jgi:predicted PurR-regulated permease PerM